MAKLNFAKIKTVSLKKRRSKIGIKDFAAIQKNGDSFNSFIESLPNILAAKDFRQVVQAMRKAKKEKKPILFMMGAHVIKCGLNPLIIDLMERGYLNALALNGAGAIHDFELAYCGQTSEDVEASIKDGSFGMSKETSDFFNMAINRAAKKNCGLGEELGRIIIKEKLPFQKYSLLANCASLSIPLTVHVAFGTDIIHPHPGCDGANLGKVAMYDFRRFTGLVSDLDGGVVLNIGSAVIMPEVFLKAISTARNLGFRVNKFSAACFDMIKHYRPMQNVVKRPTSAGGHGYYIVGHHEIMIPLLYRALLTE